MKLLRNQSCSARAWSYGVAAPAATCVARSRISPGRSLGRSSSPPDGGDETVAPRSSATVGTDTSDAMLNVWPSRRPSSSSTTNVSVSASHNRPPWATSSGANAAGSSLPPKRPIVICCWTTSALGRRWFSWPSVVRNCASGSFHCCPSNTVSPAVRQYRPVDELIVNITVFERFTRRERMSTSGLSTKVASSWLWRVSSSASAPAPGRWGPRMAAPRAATLAHMTVAGSAAPTARRRRPSHDSLPPP